MCEPNPKTGLRSVHLPAVWQVVSEFSIHSDASTELVYAPAAFNLDGTLIRAARVLERAIPNTPPQKLTRRKIIAPQKIVHIAPDGRLIDETNTPSDETFLIDFLKAFPNAGTGPKHANWESAFKAYVEDLKSAREKRLRNFRREGHHQSLPLAVAPDIDWAHDLSHFKVSADTPISFIIEPAKIAFQSDAEAVQAWEDYAAIVEGRKDISYLCNGPNLIPITLPNGPAPKKNYDDIGVKLPRIITPQKIRTFNLYGEEIE